MPKDVRLWEIQDGDRLREIKQSKLNLEARIENWLEQDIWPAQLLRAVLWPISGKVANWGNTEDEGWRNAG